MKTRYYVSFNAGRKNYSRMRELLTSIDCLEGLLDEADVVCGLYGRTFDAYDSKLVALRELLTSEGIKWTEREEHVYTDVELRSFALLWLSVERLPLDAGGPSHGTTYDFSQACARCGAGAIQTSPLFLPISCLPKSGLICTARNDEFLLAPQVAEALEEAGITGLELRRVRSFRKKEPLPWWQMISTFEMPRMSSATRGIVLDDGLPPCAECMRDGRYNSGEPCELAYSRKEVDPDSLPDVAHTWERFGRSGHNEENPKKSWFAPPFILVKPRVFDIFRRLKVKHACFDPVRFVD